ncbi:MAG: flagellar hook-basal body complex protein FliE [Actinomycetota bacterium]|nr:flagellar hook-basal body complex protein FliE [Actinomycetota bacterium]
MIPPIPAISASGMSSGLSALGSPATGPLQSGATTAAGEGGFAASLGQAIDSLQSVTTAADTAATSAAAGQGNIAEVMVATSKAELETQLFTTIRDRAVSAYNQIIDMPA